MKAAESEGSVSPNFMSPSEVNDRERIGKDLALKASQAPHGPPVYARAYVCLLMCTNEVGEEMD